MVVLDDLKDLVLYKKPFFLPIDEDDKKHNSAIMLLTPNYQSSINAMKAPYTINRRYFESYYLEKNVSRYIKPNEKTTVDEQYLMNVNEADLPAHDRNNLPDSAFGLPAQRRYPMPDKEHVLLAIKFFNYVEEKYEKELSQNIIYKIEEFKMQEEVNVGEDNRLFSYWLDSYPESALLEASSVDKVLKGIKGFISYKPMRDNIFLVTRNRVYNDDGKTHKEDWLYLLTDDNKLAGHMLIMIKEKEMYSIFVHTKYRGHGYATQLLICAVNDLGANFLSITKANENGSAHKLYLKLGFKEYDRGDEYIYFKIHHKIDESKYLHESVLNENYVFSKNDLYIHFDKFESGDSNICFVTGLSGSGKSTMAKSLASKHNAEWIELDLFERCGAFNENNIKEAGQVFFDYLSSHKELWKRLTKHEVRGKELRNEIKKFTKYVIQWCHKHKSDKYIIEGVQIYSLMDISDLKGKSLVLINASMLKSLVRKLNRTWKNRNDEDSDWKHELKQFPELIRWYIDGEKTYKEFKKELLVESTLLSDILLTESEHTDDDLAFSYYFSDEIKKGFNNTVDMADNGDEVIDEYAIMESVQSIKNVYSSIPYLTELAFKSEETNGNLYPIFIVSSFTYTKFGKLAKAINQVKEFSHVGISFGTTLSRIYSFNADNKVNSIDKGGFSTESIREYINVNQNSIINVNVFFIKYKHYKIIQDYIHNLKDHISETSYNKGNLLRVLFKKANESTGNMSMICSQFVYELLKQIGYNPLNKAANLVTPDELASLHDMKVYQAYTGLAREYSAGKVGNAIKMIAAKTKSVNEGYVVESAPIHIETCTGVILDQRGRILVERHDRTGTLNIPGGKMESGETEIAALKRELKEEIGIDVVEAKPLYDFSFGFNYVNDQNDYICKDHLYMIKKYEGKIINSESEKHGFVKFMSVDEIMAYRGDKSEILKRFISQYGYKHSIDPDDYLSKFKSVSNLVYTGYQSDVSTTEAFINQKSLKMIFGKCNVRYPQSTITIIVSGTKSDYGYISDNCVTVLSKKAFESEFKGYGYMDYIKFISAVFVYHTINQNVMDTIVYPLAMYKSGTIDTQIASGDSKYDMERVFKYISEKYGDKIIKDIVRTNDIKRIYKYALELKMTPSSNTSIKELAMLFETDDGESKPVTLDDVQNIGDKITRKIKQATVYRMNKIKRDIEHGNTGTETRGTNTLQRLQSGDLGKVDIPTPSSSNSTNELAFIAMEEGVDFLSDDESMYFLEDSINYNASLKDALYADRIRNTKQVLEIYKKVKTDCSFIKWTFSEIKRYANKNIFFDLSYYNESYFKNAVKTEDKTTLRSLKMYKELLKRLINDNRFMSYKKKTLFIPILDWRHGPTRMWIYREDLNPISIIYNMIKSEPQELVNLFGDIDIVFMGNGNYFKINFSKINIKKDQIDMKMVTLLKRIVSLGTSGIPDPDPVDEPQNSQKGIALDIVDKVEKSQNIEIKSVKPILTAVKKSPFDDTNKVSDIAVKKIDADKSDTTVQIQSSKEKIKETISNTKGDETTKQITITTKSATIKTSEDDKIKATKIDNTSVDRVVNAPDNSKQKEDLVTMIAKAAEDASSSDEAMDNLDDDAFKALLATLKDKEEDNVRVSNARAARIIELSTAFQSKNVAGKSVKDLLAENPNDVQLPKTTLPVKTSEKCWSDMTFMNFDKTYDPDSDIVKMLDHMKTWSYPVAVRDIKVTDNSTSEDYVNLWDIDCEDYKGTRFKLKVDIPKFINDKFLKLRGNEKSLMLQSTLMPIIKTDLDTCQIIGVGGYNKIFVRRHGSGSGKSMPSVDKLIKTLNKYEGKDIKITFGDNTKISNKYELPIDYIDLASYYDTIETNTIIIYFNQDAFRMNYEIDDSKGFALGVRKNNSLGSNNTKQESIIYYNAETAKDFKMVSSYISALIMGDVDDIVGIMDIYESVIATGKKYTYSKASILSIKIPLVVVCAYVEGLTSTLKKAGVEYSFKQKIDKNDRYGDAVDYIKFADGYLLYENTYASIMLMNGLKECDTESYSIKSINSKEMYMDFLTEFGGSLKSDGLENSYDCMIDPITKEILSIYKLPTDYVDVLLYANALLSDNKFVKHTDMSVRRLRRKELIAGYFYKALTGAYQSYASQIRHTRKNTKMTMKQSSVIDMILSRDPSTNDLSVNNGINDVECANTVTSKGLVGMNTDRAYSLDKRGYDPTMLNVIGMSTNHSGNVGINRQATIDCNVIGARGFISPIDGNTDKFSTSKTLTITEALTPFGSTHDDPFRTLMTHTQTSKHMVRTEYSDPLLVTNGSDEAMPYLVSDIFAFKAKKNGKVIEKNIDPKGKESYMILEYDDGSHDFIDLSEEIKKNSDGGYYVPMQLSSDMEVGEKIKTGEVIAYDKLSFSDNMGESGNLALNVGTLAKVAIMNTDEGFEDSAACTAKFARKLGTDVIVKHTKVIDKNANVFLMKKIGEAVTEGDTLLSYQTSFDDEIANSLLKNLSMSADEISELGKNPIKSHYTGILDDIRIYRTVEMNELSTSLQKLVKAYEAPIKRRKEVYKQYDLDTATLPATQKLGNTGKTKNVYDGVLIEFYIKYVDGMSIGDKVVFYSANKGILKYIIPDGDEPYTDFRKEESIDAFVSIGSINGRMVCSTQLYGSLAKLMIELDRTCKDMANIPYDPSVL